jgi:TRAP transporter TAXI family solute receptor
MTRRDRWRLIAIVASLVAAVLWISAHFLEPAPPRRIVLASGAPFGLYHQFAKRYAQILANEGVTVEERTTEGAAENLRLLLDPKSGVDVAFMQGGVASAAQGGQLEMLASLYYEPLWVFYRDPGTLSQLNQLKGKRIAIGMPGSGTRAFVTPLLEFNGVLPGNTTFVTSSGEVGLKALRAGDVDAAMLVGGALTPVIIEAVHDPALKLMSFSRADAYTRRFAHITKLTLPQGTIDLAANIPDTEIRLVSTRAMLAARPGLHPALVNLLLDAADDIHGVQGTFENAGEFPSIAQVDLPVSNDAEQHKRFGPSFLHRILPFWVATFVERFIIVAVPMIVILIPVVNYVPAVLRWRIRSRIYRWYGELSLLMHDVSTRSAPLPIEQWLRDLHRIEKAVEAIKTPSSFASEAYTLREHIALVRRTILTKAGETATG